MASHHLFSVTDIQLESSSNVDKLFRLIKLVISVRALEVLLFGVFLNNVNVCRIQKFFSGIWFSIRSQLGLYSCKEDEDNIHPDSEPSDERNLQREEVESVMGNLGLFCSAESEKLNDSLGFDDLSQLFDEKEPSLGEIKEAFDIFDENKDGFIDAEELRRVLRILGLKEGLLLNNCRKMITTYDVNRDGRIDFNEFVKFMEDILS